MNTTQQVRNERNHPQQSQSRSGHSPLDLTSIRIEELITTLQRHRPDIQHEARWLASDAFFLRLALQRNHEERATKLIAQIIRNSKKLHLHAEFGDDFRGLHVKLYNNFNGKCIMAH